MNSDCEFAEGQIGEDRRFRGQYGYVVKVLFPHYLDKFRGIIGFIWKLGIHLLRCCKNQVGIINIWFMQWRTRPHGKTFKFILQTQSQRIQTIAFRPSLFF